MSLSVRPLLSDHLFCRTKLKKCHQLLCDSLRVSSPSFVGWFEHKHDSMLRVCPFDTNGNKQKKCRLRVVAHFVCAKLLCVSTQMWLDSSDFLSLPSSPFSLFSPLLHDSSGQLACTVHVLFLLARCFPSLIGGLFASSLWFPLPSPRLFLLCFPLTFSELP